MQKQIYSDDPTPLFTVE